MGPSSGGRAWPQLAFAAVFGAFMGVVALGFILPIHWAEATAERWSREHPGFLLLVTATVPALGGLACGLINRLLTLSLRGHGVSMVLYAVARLQSRLPIRLALRQWLASTASIVTGGSSGPEGPIVTIGATLGSNAGVLAKQDREMVTTLVGAGAAAGIAAVFNAPIAGVFFALEVLLRDFSLRTLAPIVVASVLASATTQSLIGSRRPLFGVSPDVMETMRGLLTIGAAPAFVILGIACGLIGVIFIRSLRAAESLTEHSRVPKPLRPAIGGLALGLLGAGYIAASMKFGGSGMPVFMGNGYSLIERVTDPAFFTMSLGAAGESSGGQLGLVILVWLCLKIIATCLTLGSGGSGGLFAPGLVMGGLTGAAFGIAVKATGLLPQATPAHFALVGMAGAVAAMMHAPLSGILLVYELTQDYSLILPLMLTATVSTLVARGLERESVYTAELAVQGVRLGLRGDTSLLRRLTVRDVTLGPGVFVRPYDTADRLLILSERTSVEDFIVIGDDERYIGVIGGNELRVALIYREALNLLQVSEIMRTDAPTLTNADSLDIALERFNAGSVGALAVVDARGRVEGVLTRERLMRRYHEELERDA
ncbi:MAG: chloride channel protein [Phycisphaerae bacterium]|nr:chloride channel protein [Phycisphaerae bacterium]